MCVRVWCHLDSDLTRSEVGHVDERAGSGKGVQTAAADACSHITRSQIACTHEGRLFEWRAAELRELLVRCPASVQLQWLTNDSVHRLADDISVTAQRDRNVLVDSDEQSLHKRAAMSSTNSNSTTSAATVSQAHSNSRMNRVESNRVESAQ